MLEVDVCIQWNGAEQNGTREGRKIGIVLQTDILCGQLLSVVAQERK